MPKTTKTSPREFTLLSAFQLLVAILISQMAGIIGAVFTTSSISSWYVYLSKPFFNPPNWLFGPVWTMLYAMMGIALFLVWRQRHDDTRVHMALRWFFAQLALNTLWSIVFFGWKELWLGVVVILVMWWLIFKTIKAFAPISQWASWLLYPYLAWVSFATLLNLSIALLN